ncbi:MAG: FAD/NAD(P)-binding protein [Candidatus Eremiobacteraeota bacterium]|nr:FAD/NAD(P)-binding protein [Candidatus Eremiobacteraeota bacterium]
MVAMQLVKLSPTPLRMVMFDSTGAFGKGAAYSPPSDHCLLNVRAKAMSAFPDNDSHFVRWLQRSGHGDHDADFGNRFLPRRLYGEYLSALLKECRDSGALSLRPERVVNVLATGGDYELEDATGRRTLAKTVVLALGNLPPGGLGDTALSEAMAAHARPAWTFLASGQIDPEADVLIVGTGLTALDVMLHLASHDHRGRIEMLSRHGRFPLPHAPPPAAPAKDPGTLEGTPQDIMRMLRRLVRECESQGNSWHDVVDAVRPHVTSIWQSWTQAQREQFFRHVAPFWEVHRHRAPTSTLELRDRLIAAGRLGVHAGRLFALDAASDGLRARYVDRRRGRASELRVDAVIDCTGPRRDYRRSGDRLIDGLLEQGLATTDPLGMGFAAESDGRLVGRDINPRGVFVLGTPLRGTLYESSAVREIRVQAESVTRALIASNRESAVSYA